MTEVTRNGEGRSGLRFSARSLAVGEGVSPLATSRLRRSRAVDRIVAAVITAGGSTVLLAVAFLMVFLVAQCLPLFRTGSLRPAPVVADGREPMAALEDEYRESVVVLGRDGAAHVVPREGTSSSSPLEGVRPPIRQARTNEAGTLLALEDGAGTLQVWAFGTKVRWQGERRIIEPVLQRVLAVPSTGGGRILAVAGDRETPTCTGRNRRRRDGAVGFWRWVFGGAAGAGRRPADGRPVARRQRGVARLQARARMVLAGWSRRGPIGSSGDGTAVRGTHRRRAGSGRRHLPAG